MSTPTKLQAHDVLDRAIVERVAGGDASVVALGNDALGQLLRAHEAQGKEYGPLLERRLTALRKAGKLDYSRKNGWSIPEVVGHTAP